MTATLNHASVYADDPSRVAELLSRIIGGTTAPFPACEGGWVCFFSEQGWNGQYIEFYPKNVKISRVSGKTALVPHGNVISGAGTHFNISVSLSPDELKSRVDELGLYNAWRHWGGFLDVWFDDELMFEFLPKAAA